MPQKSRFWIKERRILADKNKNKRRVWDVYHLGVSDVPVVQIRASDEGISVHDKYGIRFFVPSEAQQK